MTHVMSLPRIHLFGKMADLGSISGILEHHYVVSIQTDGSMKLVLVKQILNDIDDADVSMMAAFGKQT